MSLQSADQILLPRDPTAPMEAATKQYVDTAATGSSAQQFDGGTASSVYTTDQHIFDGGSANG